MANAQGVTTSAGPARGRADTSFDEVELVDDCDVVTGTMGKLLAHQLGLRHRAVSVLIHDRESRLLIHQRAASKYHSGGLWTNACCSHPRPGEPVLRAATRRLKEEMGIDVALAPLFVMRYRALVSSRLVESEIVHAFSGCFEGAPRPDSEEVSDWRWMALPELCADIERRPECYTVWFRYFCARHWPAICQAAGAAGAAGSHSPARSGGSGAVGGGGE